MKSSNSKQVTRIDTKTLRQFGWIVGGVFLGIAVWPLLRFWITTHLGSTPIDTNSPIDTPLMTTGTIRLWAMVLAIPLLTLATVIPAWLHHPYRAWMTLGYGLGWINTRIILGLFFFIILAPVALVFKLIGRDGLLINLNKTTHSYRTLSKVPPINHYERMY